jgi:uncharacterized protein YkwD/uncharacterized membrane protein required for colicin V production
LIDLLLGAALALLVVRGWFRGFVREAMDLVGLVAGTLAAFRLSPYLGEVIADMSGASAEAARFVGGIIVFLAVGVGAAIAARALEKRARMPGLNLINRAWGAGLALGWGLFVSILLLSLLAVLPVPSAVSAQLDDSAVARTLTDPDGTPQQLFATVSGDHVVRVLLNLRDVVGARRVVLEGDEAISFPPVAADRLSRDREAADEVFDLLNRARVAEGLDPLSWSPVLARTAAGHAFDMYTAGTFSHTSAETGRLPDRLAAAGIPYVVAGENLAVAHNPRAVHDGLMDSPGHRANVLGPDFRRVGIAVVDGPLGLVTVQVLTG